MSAYEDNKVVNIPYKLLSDSRISEHDLVVLIKILSYNTERVSIISLDNDYQIKKRDIVPLVDKNILSIATTAADIYVDVNPLYTFINTTNITQYEQMSYAAPIESNAYVAPQPEQNTFVTPQPVMDYGFIERVQMIWNQALNSDEIAKITDWLKSGITKEDIEQALQKAIFNNAKNFAYAEAILLNNQTKRNSTQTVTRNVELY